MLAASTSGSAPGSRVAFAARHREVDAPAGSARGRRAERLVGGDLAPEGSREGHGIALDDEIELARLGAEDTSRTNPADHAARPRSRGSGG